MFLLKFRDLLSQSCDFYQACDSDFLIIFLYSEFLL